jgi:DNA-binding NtrC family response regulator
MRILIVDDEKNIRDSIIRYLALEGMEGVSADNGETAAKLLEEEAFDAAIVDLRMPRMGGLELLSRIESAELRVPVIMISAFGEIHDAVEAMKRGAKDYIVKPFDPEELILRLKRIIGNRKNEGVVSAARYEREEGILSLVESDAGKETARLVQKVARTDSTVLITGESGTGKEVTAMRIHALSGRGAQPFIPLNIAGIPDSLLESELFGYEKGAFTGAQARKLGLAELAAGGTLFLDEIGDLPVHLQVKILRFIQEKKIQRLGGTRIIPVDVRIIAATNRDLTKLVADAKFREDLFFRLNVFAIHLLPLRERREDIAKFARFFVSAFNRKMGKKIKGISKEALLLLEDYPFPGNIRELENSIERAFILTEGDTLAAEDFDLPKVREERPLRGGSLKEMERNAIVDALEKTGWNKTKASELLGFTRRTLFNKLKEYDLRKED